MRTIRFGFRERYGYWRGPNRAVGPPKCGFCELRFARKIRGSEPQNANNMSCEYLHLGHFAFFAPSIIAAEGRNACGRELTSSRTMMRGEIALRSHPLSGTRSSRTTVSPRSPGLG